MHILAWLVKLYILTLQFIIARIPDLTPGYKMKSSMLLYLSIHTYRDALIVSLKKHIITKDKISGVF